MKFHCISWFQYDILIMGKKEAGGQESSAFALYISARVRGLFLLPFRGLICGQKSKKLRDVEGACGIIAGYAARIFASCQVAYISRGKIRQYAAPDKRDCVSIDMH